MGKEMVVDIPMEEGDPLGAVPNDKLIIVKVQKDTLADGKLQIGDQILKVNDTPVTDQNSFFKVLRFAPPTARLHILRDEEKAAELASRVHIPLDREKLIQRREGFSYSLVKMQWKAGGPKLGLGIKHYQNRVLVSRADPGSLAGQHLMVGDHLVDIDGTPVTDKDVARDLLIKHLQLKGEITSVIERPETIETKHWTQQALMTQTAAPPSVQMNSDVRAIALKARNDLAAKAAAKPQSIMKAGVKTARVQFVEKIKDHMIASDNEGKNLRSVRK